MTDAATHSATHDAATHGTTHYAAYYKSVDVSTLAFEPLAKENKLYVARLAAPLLVQTPPVQLATSVDPEVPFVYVRPAGQFREFLAGVEAWVLDTCLQKKEEWLRKDVDDDALRHNFKSFFKGDDFKLKVGPELAVFDAAKDPAGAEEAEEGRHVRCVLELSRVCFGRQEFGAMWRLVQAQLVEVPPCLIDDAADDGEPEDGSEVASETSDDPDGEFV